MVKISSRCGFSQWQATIADMKPLSDLPASARSLWFSQLPADLRQRLLVLARERQLSLHERLFARGDAPDGLYLVVEGRIRLTGTSETGREAMLALLGPPSWFGEIALFDGQVRTHDAWADSPCRLLHLPQAALLAMLAEQPHWWREFGLLLCQKLRLAFQVIEDAALLPPLVQLARRLLAMSHGYGERDGQQRQLQVPQASLGQMLSLSRQTVNQLLGQLAEDGTLRLVRGGVEILNPERLARHAQLA